MPTKPQEKAPDINGEGQESSIDPQKIFNGSIWEPNGESRRRIWWSITRRINQTT